MAVRDYKELVAWQRAMDVVEMVYRLTARYPREEAYGLAAQTRRASVSVPSNIAEGQGRQTTTDFLHFLAMARGSVKEVETQVLIARRLHFISADEEADILKRVSEVARLITGLMNSLKAKAVKEPAG